MGTKTTDITVSRTIHFPSVVMDDIREENVHTNRGKEKKERINTEQEIIELVKLGIALRQKSRNK